MNEITVKNKMTLCTVISEICGLEANVLTWCVEVYLDNYKW